MNDPNNIIVTSASDLCKMAADYASELVEHLMAREESLVLAESCTAGLVSDHMARIPGASSVLWGSFVSYTVDAKAKMLGIPPELVEKHGAVSIPVVIAMAEAALRVSSASWSCSICGIAGPNGDGSDKPIGSLCIALAYKNSGHLSSESFSYLVREGNMIPPRNDIRLAAVSLVCKHILKKIIMDEK